MIDVVGAQPGTDELLEQVGFFVGSLGRTETGQGIAAVGVTNRGQSVSDQCECLVPGRFTKGGQNSFEIDQATGLAAFARQRCDDLRREWSLGIGRLATDQRCFQPVRVQRVVPAVAALDAQPPLVDRTLASLEFDDRVLVGPGCHRAADAAVGTDGFDPRHLVTTDDRQRQCLPDECPGRAGCSTLAARDAGALAHRLVEIEGDPCRGPLAGSPDHLVGLDVVAGSDAAVAEDAGLVVDGDDR